MIDFGGRLLVTMVGSDHRVHYSFSNDGEVFTAWKSGSLDSFYSEL
jgi:hypothetical protein